MKTAKKETKANGEFPREIESLNRNGSFFGIANRGIIPLQSFNNSMQPQPLNTFFPGYQQQVNPTPWGIPQNAAPVNSGQPFFPSFYPPQQLTPSFPSPVIPGQHPSNPAFYGAQEVTPAVNISENEESYLIDLTVPGYRSENCKVRVKDRILYVYGKRELEKETVFYSLKEYKNSFFERSFLLSDEVETEDIHANCADGILTLTLPKKSPADLKEKEIEVEEYFAS